MTLRRCAAALLAATLLLAGCSSEPQQPPPAGGNAEVGTTSDINPQDVANLQQGGNLRLTLPAMPNNFNPSHLDSEGTGAAMLRWTMPRAFRVAPDSSTEVNTDFFTNVELTSEDPQVVTYTINPEAVWSDGTPITWEDIASQINATNGKNPEFIISNAALTERVASVTRGVDDRQAVVTFGSHYTDWQNLFSGNDMLLPKSMTENPEVFNRGQLERPGPSAGPFMVESVDRTAQRITLVRNPKWWGEPPLLDQVTYLVLDDAARIPALQNNTLDATAVASLDELTTARNTPGIAIRRTPANSWYHLTFNGAPGSILEDKDLRLAIMKGVDRQAIANVSQRGLVDTPVPLNNHIYIAGQQGYQDNSQVVAFDPEKAKQELDALGWTMNGQFREKDGRQLVIRNVFYDSLPTRQIAQVAQNSLAQIGVNMQLVPAPGGSLFTDFVTVGNFDVAQFAWAGDAFALCCLTQIYTSGAESNFGKISTPEIDAKANEVLDELDPARAQELANEFDGLIWEEGFSLPLFQSAGNVAVRDTVANFGPAGLGDIDYTKVGFMKAGQPSGPPSG